MAAALAQALITIAHLRISPPTIYFTHIINDNHSSLCALYMIGIRPPRALLVVL